MTGRSHQHGDGGILPMAVSGLDIATWDIMARKAGLPLYRLLGGYRDEVPAYASAGFYAEDTGQVGKHIMTKMWADVYGYFPDVVFNKHTGPASQMWSLDDFIAADFDSVAHGFVGGATPNVENQQLPIQISREGLPPDVPAWGKG
jgi:hypothetical protein